MERRDPVQVEQGDDVRSPGRVEARLEAADLHAAHWSAWRRRHQARARWFHQRARLATTYTLLS